MFVFDLLFFVVVLLIGIFVFGFCLGIGLVSMKLLEGMVCQFEFVLELQIKYFLVVGVIDGVFIIVIGIGLWFVMVNLFVYQVCGVYIGVMSDNFCLSCGVCCVSFCVDFDCSEFDSEGGFVFDGLVVELMGCFVCMCGIDYVQFCCVVFSGQVGVKVSCGIYEWCFLFCWEFGECVLMGVGDEVCVCV